MKEEYSIKIIDKEYSIKNIQQKILIKRGNEIFSGPGGRKEWHYRVQPQCPKPDEYYIKVLNLNAVLTKFSSRMSIIIGN